MKNLLIKVFVLFFLGAIFVSCSRRPGFVYYTKVDVSYIGQPSINQYNQYGITVVPILLLKKQRITDGDNYNTYDISTSQIQVIPISIIDSVYWGKFLNKKVKISFKLLRDKNPTIIQCYTFNILDSK